MNFTYAGVTESRIAPSTASRTRVFSPSENEAGIFESGIANGESSGFLPAIPSACVTTFSSRNFTGMTFSAIPLRIWTTVWSMRRGSAWRRAT